MAYPFPWTNCQLCGLFRECHTIPPPERIWKHMTGEVMLTTKHFICFNCYRLESKKHPLYHAMVDLLYP